MLSMEQTQYLIGFDRNAQMLERGRSLKESNHAIFEDFFAGEANETCKNQVKI